MMENDAVPASHTKNDDDVLCVCFNLTRKDVRDYLDQPGKSVDDFVKDTQYGTKCTACLLDLDVTVHDLHADGISKLPPGIGSGHLTKAESGLSPWERIDSAFFVCENGVKTVLRLSNFNPLFQEGPQSVPHDYRVWLMRENGAIAAQLKGRVEAQSQAEIDFSQVPDCPSRGWFLVSLLPQGSGYYGTLRPQALLIGDGWASAFHTQFHADATKADRRVAVGIKTTGGKTWSSVSIINGENSAGDVTIDISGEAINRRHTFHLPNRGSHVVDIDECFEGLPDDAMLLLTVESDMRTRKYLINKQPDGTWGADHFPNFA